MQKAITFYGNLFDNTHCFQACLKMALKYFFPTKNYSFKYLDNLSKKKKDKWTWVTAPLVALKKMGFKVKFHSNFDYQKFVKMGEGYIRKAYPKDAEVRIRNSDILSEIRKAKEMLKEDNLYARQRISLREIFKKFKEGYIIVFYINSRILAGEKGFSGHFVLLTGFDKNNIFINNPGLPPRPNQRVTKRLFLKAWQYPEDEYSVILIKK